MAKITRIKASEGPSKKESDSEPKITRKKVTIKDKKTEKAKKAVSKVGKKDEKKPFILIRPFVALFRYLRDSWMELRQVRWPSRKATWKMVLAVLVYTALFMAVIALLDLIFGKLFNLILG